MSLITDLKRYQRTRVDLSRLRAENERLRDVQFQMTKNILDARWIDDEETGKYAANRYRSYPIAVQAINDKYNKIAKWGVIQTGNIIDLRAAFTIASGVKVFERVRKTAAPEMAFVNAFLKYNGLSPRDGQLNAYEFAKESEIEGKILLRLFWDEDDQMVSVRYVSWLSKKYTVNANPSDYLDYESVVWKENDKEVKIEWPDFVYRKVGGRVNDPNSAAPKIMGALTKIDDLDAALTDLRKINSLFSAPIFTVIFENATDAKKAQTDMETTNWKIGKGLCTNGKPSYIQPTMAGVDSLEKEIISCAKMISGSTGIPVHFLGLPDLLSNRATADNLTELIFAATLKEREAWKMTYSEMIEKAMAIMNTKSGNDQKTTRLDVKKLTIDIPFISQKDWDQVEKVLLPLSLAGKITDELILSKIPGIDVDEELDRKERENAANELKRTNSNQTFDFEDEEDITDGTTGLAKEKRSALQNPLKRTA